MATSISALPVLTFNPAICPGDLLDLELGFRETFNFMLDAEETDRNVRDAGRSIICRFLEELKVKEVKPRQILIDFATSTAELFESATCRQSQIRAASAECLLDMWAERTQIYTPTFQNALFAIKQLGANFPRPDLFEYHCFRALVDSKVALFILTRNIKTILPGKE